MYKYHGDEEIWGIWPYGTIPITGGAAKMGSSIQYGFSDGAQFPPLNVISRSQQLMVFFTKFQIPLTFNYEREIRVRGIRLLRFQLAPNTYSPHRPDAALFSMSPATTPEDIFNLTDVQTAPFFLSAPHFGGSSKLLRNINGISASSGAKYQSYLDVEPYTGKTMNTKIQMQLSTSTSTTHSNPYNVFYPNIYRGAFIPTLWVSQEASIGEEDAAYFKKQVYSSGLLIDRLTIAFALAGGVLVLLGLAFFFLWWEKSAAKLPLPPPPPLPSTAEPTPPETPLHSHARGVERTAMLASMDMQSRTLDFSLTTSQADSDPKRATTSNV